MSTRTLMGIAEIADAVNQKHATVRAWKHRGKMPMPDVELACGPVWTKDRIRSWLSSTREAGQAAPVRGPRVVARWRCPGCERPLRSEAIADKVSREGRCGACP